MSKNQQDPTTEARDITPEWAGKILDRHYTRIEEGKFVQRPVSKATINKYAMDMMAGNWRLSPQGIAFNEDDDLIDGQQRLEAVRQSKKTVRMMVSTGWPVEKNGAVQLIDVLDMGKPRTIEQMLHLHGQTCANNYTTTIRFISRVALVTGRAPAITYSSTIWMLDSLNLRVAIDKIMSNATDHRDFQGRNVGPLAYYYTSSPRKAMDFAEQLFNGTAVKGNAVWLYANWLKQHPQYKTEAVLKGLAWCIKAWHTNTDVQRISTHVESLEWLSNTNPKLRETIRAAVPQRVK